MTGPLLHVERVAELLGCSTRSVHELTRNRAIRSGGSPARAAACSSSRKSSPGSTPAGTLPLEVIEGERWREQLPPRDWQVLVDLIARYLEVERQRSERAGGGGPREAELPPRLPLADP